MVNRFTLGEPPEVRDVQPSPQEESLAICTIAAKNYLAHARCLVDSFLEHHPGGQAFVLLVDRPEGYFDPGKERFTTVPVEELQIPNFRVLSFRHTLLELCTAVKPFLLEFLFGRFGVEKLCYFDPDILICSPLSELKAELDQFGIVLTPHLVDFVEDGRYPDERHILEVGTFNLGFIGLSRRADLGRLLSWWQHKLLRDCTAQRDSGLFVDQRWIDMVPSLFDGVRILRDPTYNVAYWNLAQRTVVRERTQYTANGSPVKFFHFSGFVPEDIRQISKHQNRLTLDDVPELECLFKDYRDALLARGYTEVAEWPYAFGRFEGGIAIPDSARRAYQEVDREGTRWPDPFSTSVPGGFLEWLNQAATSLSGRRLPFSRLALQIYRERPDLQQAFPDVTGRNRQAYGAWFALTAQKEHGLDDRFVEGWRGKPRREGNRAPGIRGDRAVRGGLTSALVSRAEHLASRFMRGFVLLAFHINNATSVGRAFKRVVGRGASLRLKRALLGMSGQLGGAPAIPPLAIDHQSARAESPRPARGLNVVGYLHSESGVGEVARGTLRALSAVGLSVARTNINLGDPARQEDASCEAVPLGHPYGINLLHCNADQVPNLAAHLGREFFAGRRNVGYWFWETNTFPEQWRGSFSLFDEIWVASAFTQAALAALSPVPVVRMRPCVEVEELARGARETFALPEDRFVFLFAFDPFSISERKNPFGVVEAYRRAFGVRSKDTLLILKVNQLDRVTGFEPALGIGKDYARQLLDTVDSVSGTLLDGYLKRNEFVSLLGACDAFVSLHRSEGFGLVMAEAMLLGKPCIGTAYSSNTEFMTPANSYLVNYRLVELERDFGPYLRGSVWADPDVEHAAALMQRVVADREESRARGALGAAEMAKAYGRRAVGEEMARRLELIAAGTAR
jgi:glycosyltransferase involved in cell wall biosynthesis